MSPLDKMIQEAWKLLENDKPDFKSKSLNHNTLNQSLPRLKGIPQPKDSIKGKSGL